MYCHALILFICHDCVRILNTAHHMPVWPSGPRSEKGPPASVVSPISWYMEDFGEENVLDSQKYFFVNGPSPISEAGSLTHEKCPSDEIDRAITMVSQHPQRRAK